ncbi:DUF2007 domain-containing protein [Tamlana sp. s12]|uniref:putative signal transducing protein n=1 Tax=Flavobacteriaceae TaxID=49546 RepID=UPI0007FF72D4|nr:MULTISPECIES: DUF2007 domain-containing protein [Tamlana]OBQ52754.1 hypothetical protein VQ01_12425 [Tamlana sp. s12]QQY81226.1 DUF2007 domain-containing protein [Tamlana sp. s12]
MSDSNFTKVYTGDIIIVQRIVSELENEGISPIVKDQTESARLAGFGGGNFPGFQEIFVNNDELTKTLEIVTDITASLEEE